MTDCPLCADAQPNIVWEDARCRVIRIEDSHYPAFHRVIWREHVREMTDLTPADQQHVLRLVLATEAALRKLINPYKINLASFGNMVPHLHWHVIPRHASDRHFPEPVWGAVMRDGEPLEPPGDGAMRAAIDEALAALAGST